MASPGKTLHVRLPDDLWRRFERLHAEYKGLPTSLILKLLLADQLEKDFATQVEIVQSRIRGEKAGDAGPATNRLGGNRKKPVG